MTSDYIPQALTLHSYLVESNPDVSFLVLIIGERDDLPESLPDGPEWIPWGEIVDEVTRLALARDYTGFELSCIMKGRFHHYLTTRRDFEKWVMLDTDLGILNRLDPFWEALDRGSIALTPHVSKPVDQERYPWIEGNFLKDGLYNAGVVAMKRSPAAEAISTWMTQRFEAFGHAYNRRKPAGLPTRRDFENADQIWLNFIPLFFAGETAVIADETCNLGHWNLHHGSLELLDRVARFNGTAVVIAHFSGLPEDMGLETVTKHSTIYHDNPSPAWAELAADYCGRLAGAVARLPVTPYSYRELEPGSRPVEGAPPDDLQAHSPGGDPALHRGLRRLASRLRRVAGAAKRRLRRALHGPEGP